MRRHRAGRRTVAVALSLGLALTLVAGSRTTDSTASAWSPTVESWVTDLSSDQRLARQPGIRWQRGPGEDGSTIVVDPTRRYQAMTGFGASMTDSAASVLSELPADVRRQTMRELFSTTDGIGLSLLRQPMGASDFAVERAYSYDDQPAGATDPDLSDFSIRHDRAYLLPRLREAYGLNPELSFMATPWSAPGWMKTSDSMITGTLLPQYHEAYADYFVKFVSAYRRAGISTDYVSMQNEPLYQPPDYPGMFVLPDQAATFVGRHLGPALDRAGLSRVKILGYDHNWDITDYPEAMYADRRADHHITGTAWHCYGGEVVAQSVSHNNYPHAQAFQTECSGGTWQELPPSDPFDLTMGLVIGVPRNWGQSVVLWNLALDTDSGPYIGGCTTCRGMVTVNTETGTVRKELDYWALGHASRFVRPGAVRIGSSVHPSAGTPTEEARGLTNVAFRNDDGSVVLITYNGTDQEQTFAVQVGDRHFTATLAPRAAASYRWSAPRRLEPVADLGWVDLDFGRGPAETPTGRLTASVGPEVLRAEYQVKLADQWLGYSLPYGAELVRSGEPALLSREGWSVRASASASGEPAPNMIDGNRASRWSSGAGQEPGMNVTIDLGRVQTFSQIVLDVASNLAEYVRHYTVQTSDDGVTWTDIARGPGRPSLTGEMVIALPTTTSRHVRLVNNARSSSWWSVHELNLRNVPAAEDEVTSGRGLVSDAEVLRNGVLPDDISVIGYYNRSRKPAAVPWPVTGYGYGYRLPPKAAVTFAMLGESPVRQAAGPLNPAEQLQKSSHAGPR